MLPVRVVNQPIRQVRATRFYADGLSVASKTIGTSELYLLRTENVSRTGLLLKWESHYKIPYLINTLLEMTIDPDGKLLTRPVPCLGKVVRTIGEEKTNLQLGIMIVQIDQGDLDNWDSCITEISSKAQHIVVEGPKLVAAEPGKKAGTRR